MLPPPKPETVLATIDMKKLFMKHQYIQSLATPIIIPVIIFIGQRRAKTLNLHNPIDIKCSCAW